MNFSSKLVLNVISTALALVSLLNIYFIWLAYGSSSEADIWMMGLSIVQMLFLLSQLGVEHYATLISEAFEVEFKKGIQLERNYLLWSVIFGLFFSIVSYILLPYIVESFAPGFKVIDQLKLKELIESMLLAVASAPSVYVLRQQLIKDGRETCALIVGGVFQYVLFVYLFFYVNSIVLGDSILVGLVTYALSIVLALTFGRSGWINSVISMSGIYNLIHQSVRFRFVHSIHNFIVIFLINSALSKCQAGTVSNFQYAKKIADGFVSVVFGPHILILHAKQARAWASSLLVEIVLNIKSYLTVSVSIFSISLMVLGGGIWGSIMFLEYRQYDPLVKIFGLFALLLCWQVVIAVETIPVSLLIADSRAGLIMCINVTFIATFFILINSFNAPLNGDLIACYGIISQLISLIIFSACSFKVFKEKTTECLQ